MDNVGAGAESRRVGKPDGFVAEELASIWEAELGVTGIQLQDGFTALGGEVAALDRVAAGIASSLGIQVPTQSLLAAESLAAMADLVRSVMSTRAAPGAPDTRIAPARTAGESPPLSFAQQRLWFMQQIEPDSAVYNVPVILRMRGRLDRARLHRALRQVVARYDVLRTTFPASDGLPRQTVATTASVELPVDDLSVHADPEHAAALAAEREGARPFDLASAPPVRARLIALAGDQHWLLLTFHHIAIDGASIDIVVRDLAALYADQPPPPPPIQYADYAVWQRERLTGKAREHLVDHWRGVLGQDPAPLSLRADRQQPAQLAFRGDTASATFDAGLVDGLRELSKRERVTPYMTLLAGFHALLAGWANVTDVTVGIPVAGRTVPQLQDMVGCLINMVPLRVDLSGEPDFPTLLQRVREVVLDATAHQDLPFDQMVEAVFSRRKRDLMPLFRVMFNFVPEQPEPVFAGLDECTVEVTSAKGTAKFELTLHVHEQGDRLALTLEYDRDVFEPSTADALLAQYQRILRDALEQPPRPAARPAFRTGTPPLDSWTGSIP